jgi:hypothetical protein
MSFVVRGSLSALLLAALLLGALPATASRSPGETSLTVRLNARIKPGSTWSRDIPPRTMFKGEYTKGDTVAYEDTLRNADRAFGRPKGAVVGSADTVLTMTTRARALFHVQMDLPGGSLRLQGRDIYASETVHLPVVAGSGAFVGARGSTAITQLSRLGALYVVHVRTP